MPLYFFFPFSHSHPWSAHANVPIMGDCELLYVEKGTPFLAGSFYVIVLVG